MMRMGDMVRRWVLTGVLAASLAAGVTGCSETTPKMETRTIQTSRGPATITYRGATMKERVSEALLPVALPVMVIDSLIHPGRYGT